MTQRASNPGDGRRSRRDERFPKRLRLTHRLEYQAVHAAKMRANAGPLLVYGLPNDRAESRLGLSVSRRVGAAVRRNAIKRRLREAFRTGRADMPAGYDIVISVHAHEPLTTPAYRRLLIDALTKIDTRWRRNRKQSSNEHDPPTT